MTCREKLKIEHPVNVSPQLLGGCAGCPEFYGYETKEPETEYCRHFDCEGCWNREVVEDEV